MLSTMMRRPTLNTSSPFDVHDGTANCRLGESAAEDPSAQHRCGESVMMNSEGGTSPWWHWLLDLKMIYFAPDLVMPDMLPLGKD